MAMSRSLIQGNCHERRRQLSLRGRAYKEGVDQIEGERPVTFASAHLRLLKALDRAQEPLLKEALEDAPQCAVVRFRKKVSGDIARCDRPQRQKFHLLLQHRDPHDV
jgi:hypothetical protein